MANYTPSCANKRHTQLFMDIVASAFASKSLMTNHRMILTSQRVSQLREEIEELKFMNEVLKYKKGPVADTERVRRQGRLLEIQDELVAKTKPGEVSRS
jgi:hypothetical protein